MAFGKSVESNNNGGAMIEGLYEVQCMSAGETTTKSGIECVAFDFVVRSDVEQKYQKKHIFKNFFKDDKTNSYPFEKIGRYAAALGIKSGEEYDLCDLVGKCCQLYMKPFTKDDGTTIDTVYYATATKVGQLISAPATGLTEVADDDLPF